LFKPFRLLGTPSKNIGVCNGSGAIPIDIRI
jgi:hypothetical protein